MDKTNLFLTTPSKKKWQRIGTQKRSGICVPLFSVYSQKSTGIGDFSDLTLLVEWAKKTGQSIVQLLPMNEMGAHFCPYDAISSFALEPSYIALEGLVSAQHAKLIPEIKRLFPAGKAHVDFGIKKAKIGFLKELFLAKDARQSAPFKKFKKENEYWLEDFSLYKVLKEYHQGKPWYEWGVAFRDRQALALESFKKAHAQEIAFEMWLQWQLYEQFKKAKESARAKGVFLKGDLPILVSRDSADVWAHPHFFKLELAAGAPPDMYCAKGQRWGMPPYSWKNIANDGYRYLIERLKFAQNFYDILRVDHVVGLFRIWSIPYDEPLENQGLNGFFDPRQENLWGGYGKTILSVIIDNTDMLLCGEDLGVIPPVCTRTLKELGIPGNDVQRWVKDWDLRRDFLAPQEFRLLSVAMLSTHDTTNVAAWWENEAGTVDEALFIRKCAGRIDYERIKDKLFDSALSRHGRLRWLSSVDSSDTLLYIMGKKKEEIKDFIDLYKNSFREKEKLWQQLKLTGPMREEADAAIVAAALSFTLASQAIFSIQLITDWLYLTNALKEDSYQYRINTPGTTNPQNWSLVMPISLDELLRHPVNVKIKAMVASSGRI